MNAKNLGDFLNFLEEKYSIKCFEKLRTYLALFNLFYIIFCEIQVIFLDYQWLRN